jgi:hypothetical protein
MSATFKRDPAAEAIFPELAELGAALEQFQAIDKPTRHPDLTWHDFDELADGCLPFGWTLSAGYTVEREPGDAPTIWIFEVELNTGQRVIPLSLTEVDTRALEAILEDVVAADDAAESERMLELARDRNDDGDYAYDRSLDK